MQDRDAKEAPNDDRQEPGSPSLGATAGDTRHPPQPPSSLMAALLQEAYKPTKPGTGNLRHGSEGWKELETSVHAMHGIVSGCGKSFAPHADADVCALLYKCGYQPRFVSLSLFQHLNLGSRNTELLQPELLQLATRHLQQLEILKQRLTTATGGCVHYDTNSSDSQSMVSLLTDTIVLMLKHHMHSE